jgi:two-component system chemotaxis response regulator CheY
MQVLVLDDSELMRSLVVKQLLETGVAKKEITEACNGVDALRKIGASDFDLLILDIVMDGVDGIGVLKAAKSIRPNAKVIMCSTFSEKEAVRELIDLGIDDFVVKPFSAEKLAESLRQVLAKKVKE